MAATSVVGGCLAGKLALVTGGGNGIGRAVCMAFGHEGAKVIVADIDEAAAKTIAESLPGNSHIWIPTDVGQSQSVKSLLDAIIAKYKQPPTIAVNCAGITRDKLLAKMDEQNFDDVIRINLKGTFLVTQAVSRAMMKEGLREGSIINISSIVGKVGNVGQTNYAASKAGVIGMTKSSAKELAKFGIRCNAVLPGFVETEMIKTIPTTILEQIKEQIPMGRTGTPEEIADLCVFLASNKSSYITGAAIEISGGLLM